MTQYYKLRGYLDTIDWALVCRAMIAPSDEEDALRLARDWGQQVHHTNGVRVVQVSAMPSQPGDPEKLCWQIVVGPGTEGYREPPLYYEQTLR